MILLCYVCLHYFAQSYILKLQCLSVYPGSFQALLMQTPLRCHTWCPDLCFFFFDGFYFLWQLLPNWQGGPARARGASTGQGGGTGGEGPGGGKLDGCIMHQVHTSMIMVDDHDNCDLKPFVWRFAKVIKMWNVVIWGI
jgi:hypothetical protein